MVDRLREAGVRQIVYDVQFTEPSEDPDDDLALYDAIDRAGRVILATGEIDDAGRHARARAATRASPRPARAQAAASTFPTDPGGAIRRYARRGHAPEHDPGARRRALRRRAATKAG